MSTKNLERTLIVALALFLAASCGNGTSAQDAGDEDADTADADTTETDTTDAEADGVVPDCGEGTEEGSVCDDDPRSICREGICTQSTCGDGFVDTGAGEFCEPPGTGGCSSMCRWLCETSESCPDDGNPCNGEEYCDEAAHECGHRNPLEDGAVCGEGPRRICVAGTCQVSACGDGIPDEVMGEECDDGRNGDPDDGCTDACTFSCHENADCEDENPCTVDICDTVTSHSCFYTASPLELLCRPSAGECDAEEYCDGVNSACPDDDFAPSTTECRASTSQCDAAEMCTGTSAACPADVLEPPGTPCDDGIFCTNPDACDADGACVGTPATGLYGVSAIQVGSYHTCALMSTGGVKCWGQNGVGQLGDGTTTDRLTPVDVAGLSSAVSAISAGGSHNCALTSTGGVKCWGDNSYGALGDGTTTSRLAPVDVSGLSSGVSAIAAGGVHTCAIMSTGGAKCWGYNGMGRLGDGTTTDRYTPVDVSGLSSGVIAIAASGGHTCAVMSTGGVKCWGFNGMGQLGDNTTTNRYTPVDVVGIGVVVSSITAGASHTCALTSTGLADCWGYNSSGQLGDGTTTNRLTPVSVYLLYSGVSAIAAGSAHTCALMDTGGMKCWGQNDVGQLGDGSTTNRIVPIDVFGISSGASAIDVGAWHTCAMMSTGGAKCWGSNSEGQLGDGSTANRLTPVDVLCE